MKQYRPKTITYSTNLAGLTTDTTPIYTVPIGVVSKLTFAYMSNGSYYLKINNTTATAAGTWIPSAFNGVSMATGINLTTWGIYLNAGDSLYVHNAHTAAPTTTSLTLCFIEEYEA